MPRKLVNLRKGYYNYIDRKARNMAYSLKENKKVSKLLLDYISELYDSANSEKDFSNTNFESAYHQPITSDLEFLMARIFYHYSNLLHLNWTIYLRKQKKDRLTGKLVAPDIKIEKKGKIIAILEIKAKAGWMQSFFSKKSEVKEKKRGKDPKKKIGESKAQLLKYASFQGCDKTKVFVFLPTFVHVDRKKNEDTIDYYRNTFAKNSTLSGENLIVLSRNPSLNLSLKNNRKDYLPTSDFEKFIKKIKRI